MKKRMVPLIISMLLLFSTISISVYAAPSEDQQLSSENQATEETDSATITDQGHWQQEDEQEEAISKLDTYMAESTNSPDADSNQEQESLPITIQVDLGEKRKGTLTIQENETGHEAQFSINGISGNEESATLELEKDEVNGEWSVTKCDTYNKRDKTIQSILRVVVAVMIGCAVSFLGLAIIIKSRR